MGGTQTELPNQGAQPCQFQLADRLHDVQCLCPIIGHMQPMGYSQSAASPFSSMQTIIINTHSDNSASPQNQAHKTHYHISSHHIIQEAICTYYYYQLTPPQTPPATSSKVPNQSPSTLLLGHPAVILSVIPFSHPIPSWFLSFICL